MTYEDRTLICTECNSEFVFSAGEQSFYQEKGLTSEPKRCKACRDNRRKKKRSARKGGGIYRSPAFEGSAPAHQKIRGRRGSGRGRGDYRSPGLKDRNSRRGEYRSPAFREYETIKPEQEYRAPGFHEYNDVKPEDEYRGPGFQEYADIDVRQEYRAPGYQESAQKYLDERPMFAIVCAACGEEAMVPFLPEEREEVFCEACYKKRIEEKRAAEAAAEAAAREAAEAEARAAAETMPLEEDEAGTPAVEGEPDAGVEEPAVE
jgi:CxxC-x17-CxxC domain-containing protein